MAIPFLKGIDVTGTVDLSNLTVDGAQGTDGQVLTSTGSGIAWEDASGGASLSGGAANKLAIWSGTDALTNDTNLHWDTTNDRLGIGTDSPARQLTIFDSTGSRLALTGGSTTNCNILFGDTTDDNKGSIRFANSDSSFEHRASIFNFKAQGSSALYINSSGNVGINTTSPNRPLVVSETRTGSTASDAYTAIVKSVQSSGASPNPGTGGLKVQYTSSSSNVHAFGLVAGSSSSDFLTTGPMHFYTNSDLDTVSATGFAMQLDTSQRLTIGSMTASQKLNVNGNVTANRYYGNGTTAYYLDPNDVGTSIYTVGDIRTASGFTSDGLGKLYAWRAVDNTTSNSTNYVKIARLTGTASGSDYYSDRCIIELAGRSSSYSNNQLPAMGYIVAQLQSDANWDVVYYNHHNGTDEVVDEVGVVQINNTQADIYVRVGSYAEVTASAHISDGYITVDNTRSGSAPSGYSAANAEYKVWNSGNDGSGSGLDADTLDGQHASAFLTAHPNISAASSSNNSGNTFIQDITLDSNGHITALATGTASFTETYTQHDNISAASSSNNSGRTYIQDITLDSNGHVTGIATATETVTAPTNYLTDNAFDSGIGLYLQGGSFNAGTDTVTAPLVIDEEDFIYTKDGGYLRKLIGKTSDQIQIGQSGTSLISSINFLPGTAGNNAVKINSNTVWNAGNDGAGSGLDADLLDGVQGADYFKKGADIGGSQDLNNYTTDGYYHQNANANASSGSNYPVSAAGMLSVVSDGSMVYQTYHQYNGNAYYHRSYYNGTWYAWRKVWQDGNDGSGSGLDADTVDGIQGGSFLRSDANDSFTGDELHFPTLDLSISNNNSQNNGNTYFRGTGTHFVLGLNNGNTCYLNYGNSSGALRLYGSSIYWNDSNIGSPWGSANDGSGSGLDADLLDGAQGSSYLRSDASDTFNAGNAGLFTVEGTFKVANPTATSQAVTISNASSGGNTYISNGSGNTIFFGVPSLNTTNIEVQGVAEAEAYRGRFNTSYYTDHEDTGDSIRVAGDIVAFYSSDKRYKENIKPIESPIEKVKAISGVTFEWNEKSHKETGKKDIGVIAQEVEKVLPEIVQTRDNGYKAVDYQKLTAVLIEAVKDQQKQIDELKSIINGGS